MLEIVTANKSYADLDSFLDASFESGEKFTLKTKNKFLNKMVFEDIIELQWFLQWFNDYEELEQALPLLVHKHGSMISYMTATEVVNALTAYYGQFAFKHECFDTLINEDFIDYFREQLAVDKVVEDLFLIIDNKYYYIKEWI